MRKEKNFVKLNPSLAILAIATLLSAPMIRVNDSYAWDILKSSSTSTLNEQTASSLEKTLNENAAKLHLDAEALRAFYAEREWKPVWMNGEEPSSNAQEAIGKISAASEDGLNPQQYSLSLINQAQLVNESRSTPATRAIMELLISQAVLSYASDIGYGATARQNKMRIENFVQKPAATQLLLEASSASNIQSYLSGLAPQSGQYASLKSLLADYRQLASKGGWPHIAEGKTLKAGMHDMRIPDLRRMLTMTHDLTAATFPTHTSDATDTLFSEDLVAAVKRFQARHGLEADGVLGASTQQALSVSTSDRIDQIIATMERMRWLPTDLGNRYVLVNVPSYSLVGYKDGKSVLNMRVITGDPKNATPLFSNEIREVSFNPTWGVPARIAVKEMLPKIKDDPEYLVRAGYRVTSREGDVVDPLSVDWEQVSSANFDYNLRQEAGKGNALGKIKFLLPDNQNVYLHDTSSPKLFAKAERALSHGCIRLENPRAMAHFVLDGQEGWDTTKVDQFYDGNSTRTIRVQPLPVHLTYYTAYVDESSRTPYFFRDVYGLDGKTVAALNRVPANDIQLAQN